MVKTTVYLSQGDLAAVKRLAAASGRSQSEVIREAIARETAKAPRRQLKSLGAGRGTGEPVGQNFDEYLKKAGFGSRKLFRS